MSAKDSQYHPQETITDADETTLERSTSERGGAAANVPVDPYDFGELAVRNGLISREVLNEARNHVAEQEAKGRRIHLEQCLVDRGHMTSLEIKAITKQRERHLREKQKKEGVDIPGYELMGTLGEGGLGVVYKARQVSMNRLVALKVLHPHWITDDEFRKRFILEARVVGKLSHQNLIQVYDVGKEGQYYYFSMEYVPGKTVEQLIEDRGPFEITEAIHILIQMVRAIRYYKDYDIVHRDVKPSNIIVTRQNVAKLGDFGFVKSKLDKELGYEGMVLGTPDYISPEQAMGEEHVDWRSDIYSLGATFYHMVAGSPPFEGSGSTVMLKHVKESPPNPKTFNSKLPDTVIHVIDKMMAKKPADRYPTFELLFEDLELLRAGRSPQAPRAEVGRSTLFRAYKIEQTRLAQLAEDKRKLEQKLDGIHERIDRLTIVAAVAGAVAALMTSAFVLSITGVI